MNESEQLHKARDVCTSEYITQKCEVFFIVIYTFSTFVTMNSCLCIFLCVVCKCKVRFREVEIVN